jgi:thiamine biosynthesis lipoprotein
MAVDVPSIDLDPSLTGAEAAWISAQRRIRAMGTDGHILVVGPRAPALVDRAVGRIADLESRWSRFLATSEISELNRQPGRPVPLSPDSLRLIETAMRARRLTQGRFDPTLGVELIALGYDCTFDQVRARTVPVTPALDRDRALPPAPADSAVTDPVTIDRAAGTATVAPGRRFDPGGIGKGLAADLVVEELLADGAWGAMVNLGGDLRVGGVPPSGPTWVVEIDHPHHGPLTTVELVDGGLATSTTLLRRWSGEDRDPHHLLDPATGRPHERGTDFVTVIASSGWWAEAAATALIGTDPGPGGGGSAQPSTFTLAGCAALLIAADRRSHPIGGFSRFERPGEGIDGVGLDHRIRPDQPEEKACHP